MIWEVGDEIHGLPASVETPITYGDDVVVVMVMMNNVSDTLIEKDHLSEWSPEKKITLFPPMAYLLHLPHPPTIIISLLNIHSPQSLCSL